MDKETKSGLKLSIKSKEFVQSLIYVQENLVANKDTRNDFGDFNYRNAEVILSKLKPLLQERDLFQYVSDGLIVTDEDNYVKAEVIVTDGESTLVATAFARETESRKKMNPPQLTGSASSYARKYALQGAWGIDDEKRDPDHQDNHPSNVKNKSKKSKKKSKSKKKKKSDNDTLEIINGFDDEVALLNWWKDQEDLDEQYEQAVRDKLDSF